MNWRKLTGNGAFKFLLKLAFVMGLLMFLTKRGLLSIEDTRKAFSRWDLILQSYCALLISVSLCFFRWGILLRALGIQLPWKRIFQLSFVGAFFNIALPGAVTGDVVKAYYVANEAPGKRAWALSSILFDRVAGLSALILVSAGALFLSLQAPWGAGLMKAVSVLVGISGLSVVSFFLYLFFVKETYDPLLVLFKNFEKKWGKFGSVTRIYEGIKAYRNHRKAVLQALGLSLLVHFLVIISTIRLAEALGEVDLTSLGVFVIVPLCLVVTAIPIMPGGVGTGHAAFAFFFANYLGSQRGADIFSLYVLFMFALGGIGGLVYLKFKANLQMSEAGVQPDWS